MKNLKTITFWALVLLFLIFVLNSFIPIIRGFGFFIFLAGFFLLGLLLLILSWKRDTALMLTALSCVCFPVFVILHNMFYALRIPILEGLFFLLAIPVCPILFLVGIITVIVKNKSAIIK